MLCYSAMLFCFVCYSLSLRTFRQPVCQDTVSQPPPPSLPIYLWDFFPLAVASKPDVPTMTTQLNNNNNNKNNNNHNNNSNNIICLERLRFSSVQRFLPKSCRAPLQSSGSVLDHPGANLGVGISEGCFFFDLASLPLEVIRPIQPTMCTKVAVKHKSSSSPKSCQLAIYPSYYQHTYYTKGRWVDETSPITRKHWVSSLQTGALWQTHCYFYEITFYTYSLNIALIIIITEHKYQSRLFVII